MPRLLVLAACAATLLPAAAAGQVVIRDDTSGWAWLGMIEARRGVVHLSYANAQTGTQGQLGPQLLEELTARGIGRVDTGTFDPASSQLLAECTATDRSVVGGSEIHYAVHAEVSYWDHNRLAATEIYESLRIASVPPTEFRPDTYVQACADQVADVLEALGFTTG